jgi:hypothetical protein
MPVCDSCNATTGADAIRYTAGQLRHAVDTGYRPQHRVWPVQAHRDPTDWLLCGPCARDLDAHLDRHAGARPPRWRDLFGKR